MEISRLLPILSRSFKNQTISTRSSIHQLLHFRLSPVKSTRSQNPCQFQAQSKASRNDRNSSLMPILTLTLPSRSAVARRRKSIQYRDCSLHNTMSNPLRRSVLHFFPEPAVGSVVSLLVVAVIAICVYKFAKKATPGVVRKLRNITAPPPLALNAAPAAIWEVDAPTMEKFFREIAEEKPVRFTARQLYTFTNNYSTCLGSGGFGEVYKGKFPNGVNVAVKVLKRSLDKRAEEQFMAEVGSICRTYHINLVRLYGFCYDHFMSALVFEYLENGSLDKYLFGKRKQIEWRKLHDIAIGTARGLAYLHEECQHRIIHYDIKPANILLDANFLPKVGDFRLAKLCNRDNTHISFSGYRGTPGYLAPEFLLINYPITHKWITHKYDVYSFGMVLFEIIGRKSNASTTVSANPDWFPQQLWDAYENDKLEELIVGCGIGEEDREMASRACEVALWCVQDSPDGRPPMSAVVKMLEGGVEIMPPAKPFQYLNSMKMGRSSTISQQTSGTSSESWTSRESNSQWYRQTTTIMRKYEIQTSS